MKHSMNNFIRLIQLIIGGDNLYCLSMFNGGTTLRYIENGNECGEKCDSPVMVSRQQILLANLLKENS